MCELIAVTNFPKSRRTSRRRNVKLVKFFSVNFDRFAVSYSNKYIDIM